jgi:hypothetical protein
MWGVPSIAAAFFFDVLLGTVKNAVTAAVSGIPAAKPFPLWHFQHWITLSS